MPQFFVTCPRGIEPIVEKELHALGITKTEQGVAGVGFHGNWQACYKANLELTSASRVLYPVLDFPAYDQEHIYHNILKHDWTKYITPEQTLAMDSSVRDSIIRDIRVPSLKAKDAVVDQFRDKFGVRPDVDTENPDMQISIRIVKNQCTVSLDTSGGSLHERGYRDRGAPAPLKENLAAALIKMTGWDGESPLMDPMCGSGTFCIEAALMALKIPPGVFRKRFGFQKWKTFQAEVFQPLVDEIGTRQLEDVPFRIYGSDKDMRAIAAARANTENAGTEVVTIFKRQELAEFVPAPTPGILITNPPYGQRMGSGSGTRGGARPGAFTRPDISGSRDFSEDKNFGESQSERDLLELYTRLGDMFREKFMGWKCWVLTSNPEAADALAKAVGHEPRKSIRVFNGAIECRFLRFEP